MWYIFIVKGGDQRLKPLEQVIFLTVE